MINEFNLICYTDLLSFIDSKIDYLEKIKKQYLSLMNELTVCPDISNELFYQRIKQINSMGKIIIGYTCSNIETNKDFDIKDFEIIGSGTIIIEPKIFREGMSVGHIEDIVVKSTWRGKKVSQNILNKLKNYAKISNCYKVILDCNEQVSQVYKANGFEVKGIQMSQYFL